MDTNTTIPLAHFTTYLGSLVKESGGTLDGLRLNRKQLRVSPLLEKRIMGKYEATITYLAYFSRIIYENRARKILKSFPLFNYSPLTFNKGLSFLTFSSDKDTRIEQSTKKPYGYLLYDSKQDTPVSITVMDHTMEGNQSVLFPNEKILVIAFRGTLSLTTALKDMNIAYQNLFNLYGKDAFPEEYEEAEKRKRESKIPNMVNPFGAHRGFVNGIIEIYPKILARMKYLLEQHPDVSRIFVTGHSLGGAFCHLMIFGLAQLKKKGMVLPNLHAISFGAPKVFTDYARNVFNDLLLEGYMTLDRVTNRPRFPDVSMVSSDPIPYIPSTLDHPGFMILKKEIKTQSRTGRTKHVREIRDELFGITPDQSFFSALVPNALKARNYNSLPEYKEFVEIWLDGLTPDEYKKLINSTPGGTVRIETGAAKKIFDAVKRIFFVSDAEIKSVDAVAEQAIKKEEEVLEDSVKNLGPLENAAKANASQEAQTTDQTTGGGLNTNKYKALTVLEQPNHLVYSCFQITAPVPLIGCHLGYMGVSWLGAGINTGSGTLIGSRDYKEIAELYCDNGIWTYKPNYDSLVGTPVTNTVNPIIAANKPLNTIGGFRSRKRRGNKKRNTRRR
jgi:hypothetical protein